MGNRLAVKNSAREGERWQITPIESGECRLDAQLPVLNMQSTKILLERALETTPPLVEISG